MRIGVLGTGGVGRTLAGRLAGLGHDVRVGTRDPAATLDRAEGGESFAEWAAAHPSVGLVTLAEAAAHGELVINATNGAASLDALELAGAEHLAGKVLVDVANPLDFSDGFPPTLTVANTDSLAEQIQGRFPDARVVKTLNTMNAAVMIDPDSVGRGDHSVFLSGDDAAAKEAVAGLLREMGWRDIVDLGGIESARGAEMVLPLWVRLLGPMGGPAFQLKVVRGQG